MSRAKPASAELSAGVLLPRGMTRPAGYPRRSPMTNIKARPAVLNNVKRRRMLIGAGLLSAAELRLRLRLGQRRRPGGGVPLRAGRAFLHRSVLGESGDEVVDAPVIDVVELEL